MALFKQECPSCGARFIQPTMENVREGDPWYKLTPQRMVCPNCGKELQWSRVSAILRQVPLLTFVLGGVINLFVADKETRGDVMGYSLLMMVIGLLLWFAFRKVQANDCE